MKGERRRSILHVDLDPFFVSVERSLDPGLRGRPVVVGGDGHGMGFVAAVSDEARQAGVRVGLPVSQALLLCPDAAFRRGDLDAYGRHSEEVTAVLLAASRRVERPSADEGFLDLTPDSPGDPPPVRAAETVRDELQRRLGLDASLGLASSRLAARVASGFAKPRGLLVVLPGYESSFLAGKPIAALGLPPRLETALGRAGFATVGQVAEAEEKALAAAVGAPAAPRLRAAARGEQEAPIAVAAPPAFLLEEATIRDRRSDRQALEEIADALARRAARRLRPFRLAARSIAVEVRRTGDSARRADVFSPGLADEDAIAGRVLVLLDPLLDPVEGVRGLHVRLGRLDPPTTQAPLFPASPALRRAL
jgi:DNA polymerase-4